jgi:hypothetical protein
LSTVLYLLQLNTHAVVHLVEAQRYKLKLMEPSGPVQTSMGIAERSYFTPVLHVNSAPHRKLQHWLR